MNAYNDMAADGEWDNVYRVFYSFGRTYAIKLRLNF